jgi:hypothetical protein
MDIPTLKADIVIKKFVNPTRMNFKNFAFLSLCINIIIFLYSVLFNGDINLSGDEGDYFRTYLKFMEIYHSNTGEGYFASAINNGYFVPGTSFYLFLVSLFLDFFGFETISTSYQARLAMSFLNIVLVYCISLCISKISGNNYIILIVLVVLGTVPFYNFYIGALWGEVTATNLAILSILLYEINLKFKSKLVYILIGVFSGLSALIRPQFVILPLIFFIRVFIKFNNKNDHVLKSDLIGCILIGIICFIPISHWNEKIEDRFGSFFMVVSPSEYKFVIDDQYSKKAKAATGESNDWYSVHDYLMKKSIYYKLNLRETIEIEENELHPISIYQKLLYQYNQVLDFYSKPNHFMERFFKIGNSILLNNYQKEYNALNKSYVYIIFILGWIMFLLPWKFNPYLFFYYKALFFLITSQSLLYFSHPRYYISLLPIILMFFGLSFNKCSENTYSEKYIPISRIGYIACLLYAMIFVSVILFGSL